MIALVLLAATMQPASEPPAEQGSVTREQNGIQIPKEIAPAVFPYFQCVMTGMNQQAEFSPIASADMARAAQQRAIASCQAVRSEAKAKALELLSQSNVKPTEREAFAEMALKSIDHAPDSIVQRLERNAQK